MKNMATYDLMEATRNTNEWLGASARAFASYPIFGMVPHPFFKVLSAWGRITERSFARMVIKPDWGIISVPGDDGRDAVVTVESTVKKAFGDLIHFKVQGRAPRPPMVVSSRPATNSVPSRTSSASRR